MTEREAVLGTHRVVVIGGGFGGLQAALRLRAVPVELTLVDRRNFHLFQPLTYQVATGALSPSEVAYPLRTVFRGDRQVRVVMGEVTGFDLHARTVTLEAAPRSIPYDTLVVAGGSHYSYFGHDQWRANAPQVKSLESALDVRRRILGAFEAAELEADPERRRSWLAFVVVGAGPTGVEMAGQIGEMIHDLVGRDFRRIDAADAHVLLVEGADRVLTSFPPSLSKKAARSLRSIGVTPMLGRLVVDVTADAVSIKGGDDATQRVEIRTVIWAAGVEASRLARRLGEATGADVDRTGRVSVKPDLTLPGHPEVFAVGTWSRCAVGMARRSTCRAPRRSPSSRDATRHRHPRPPRRPSDAAVLVPRQGKPRHDRPCPRGGRHQEPQAQRIHRLADLARRPPLVPDRLPEPDRRRGPLVVQLPHPRPQRATDHGQSTLTLKPQSIAADGAVREPGTNCAPSAVALSQSLRLP